MNRELKVKIYDAYSISSSDKSFILRTITLNEYLYIKMTNMNIFLQLTYTSEHKCSFTIGKIDLKQGDITSVTQARLENNHFTNSPIHDFGFKNRFTIY